MRYKILFPRFVLNAIIDTMTPKTRFIVATGRKEYAFLAIFFLFSQLTTMARSKKKYHKM